MAVYTPLSSRDAERVATAHRLGAVRSIEGLLAGSVNSNFFVDTDAGRFFVRIYEEQDAAGVEYEWALLAHLAGAGLPVPIRVDGPPPGALRVEGKPTAVFEVIGGREVCQRMVDPQRAEAVGALLGRAHRAGAGFSLRRGGRFTLADVRRRLEGVSALDRPELREAVSTLRATLDEVDAAWDATLPSGVIHGDLFRDNVRWEDKKIVGALDWESASDGLLVYDLAVAMLAWCYGETLETSLTEAMMRGYERERALEDREREFLPTALGAAAARFTTTRITDFHLREGSAQVKKDWRRFYARLLAVR